MNYRDLRGREMLNLHQEPKCSAFQIVVILIVTMAAIVAMALILDTAMEKSEQIAIERLNSQLSPEQRADVMRGGK